MRICFFFKYEDILPIRARFEIGHIFRTGGNRTFRRYMIAEKQIHQLMFFSRIEFFTKSKHMAFKNVSNFNDLFFTTRIFQNIGENRFT